MLRSSHGRALFMLATLIGLASAAACRPDPARANTPSAMADVLPAVVEWYGADGHIKQPEFVRITSAEAWTDLWLRHTGNTVKPEDRWLIAVPKIDFERYMVVAVFRGDSINTRGERLTGYETTKQRCLIRYDSASYQTASFDGNPDPGVQAVSYGIWVLPKAAAPLVFEENVQGMFDKDPIWKERFRLP